VRAFGDLVGEHVMPTWRAYGGFHEGWLHWHAGDRQQGTARMNESLRLMREHGQLFIPFFEVLLAETEASEGRHDAALARVDAAVETITRTGQCWYLADALRVRGEILLLAQPADIEPAETAFARAIDTARAQSAKQFERRAAMSVARSRAARGERAAHRGLLASLAADSEADEPAEASMLTDGRAGF
jgi:predicted ATPase